MYIPHIGQKKQTQQNGKNELVKLVHINSKGLVATVDIAGC